MKHKLVRGLCLWLACLLVLPLAACVKEDAGSAPETSETTATETDTESVADTATETDTESATDTETETDTATETDAESVTDTETETDTATETDTESEMDTESETDTETETETETEPPCSHDWTEWAMVTPLTCLSDGEQIRTCHICGEEERQTLTTAGHIWYDWETNKKATCTQEGSKYRICFRCREKEWDTIPAKGHTERVIKGYAPTCTRNGYADGLDCSVCYVTLKELEYLPATGHSYQNHVCTVCGHQEVTGVGLTYVSNRDGTCYVSGMGKCTDQDLIIPAVSPAGDRVTAIGEFAFVECYDLKSVTVPESVTRIGVSAFCECKNLEALVIPKSVTHIEGLAFVGCSSLRSVDLPDGLIYLGENVFAETSVTIEVVGGVHYVENWAVGCDRGVTSVTFREGTKGIADAAFWECMSLTHITLPQGITYIGDYTFFFCRSLKKIVLPDGVTYIGERAFEECASLTEVTIPASVTRIRYGAFLECRSLTKISYGGTKAQWAAMDIAYQNEYLERAKFEYAPGPHSHAWSAWSVVTPATCVATGEEARTCSGCGARETRTVQPNGKHTESIIQGHPATCNQAGLTDGVTCTACGVTLTPQTVIPATGKHQEKAVVGYAPSCNQDGLTDGVVCHTCGATLIAQTVIPSTGEHDGIPVRGYPATCTSQGLTDGVKCRTCEKVLTPQTAIPMVGHDWGDWAVSIPATCENKGKETCQCKTCGQSKSRVIDSVDHVAKVILGYPATCTEAGRTDGTECTFCGMVMQAAETIPALKHSWGPFSTTVEPTCTTDGEMYHECSRCGVGATVISVALGHRYVSGVCQRCGDKEAVYSKGLLYEDLGDGTCRITGMGTCTDAELIIPSKSPDGKTVVQIAAKAFANQGGITHVHIPSTVAYMGNNAFEGCVNLSSVYMEDGASLGGGAFENCVALTTVRLPETDYLVVGGGAFEGCVSLTAVEIPYGARSIGERAFLGCTSLAYVQIPKTVLEICKNAFTDCHSLVHVFYAGEDWRWGMSVKIQSGNGPVSDPVCYRSEETVDWELKYVSNGNGTCIVTCDKPSINPHLVIPATSPNGETVTTIRYGAFMSCAYLERVTLPNTLMYIEDGAFANCPKLTEIDLPDGVLRIESNAFYHCTSLTRVGMPKNLTFIGSHAFAYCTSLPDLDIPDSVSEIHDHAFRGCTKLLEWLDGVAYVDRWLVETEKNLVRPALRSDMVGIAWNAFENCQYLVKVAIPNGTKYIGTCAFFMCESLTDVTIPQSVIHIGESAFAGCNGVYHEVGGIYYVDGWVIGGDPVGAVVLPNGTKGIMDGAFYYCQQMTSIVIPEGVRMIGNKTFYECSALQSVEIPQTVTYIGADAFNRCSSLKEVSLPAGLTFIGNNAFAYCYSLKQLVIPDGVTSVETRLLYQADTITEVVIPISVAYINPYAFSRCEKLTSIVYQGTMAQWKSLTKGYEWDYLAGKYTVHCSDGDISR